MRQALLVLIVFGGLGSTFSIAQGASQISSFDSYLSGIRSGRHEAALMRVAAMCGVNPSAATVHNADRPYEDWKLVRNLGHARDEQETDFFATAQVWQSGDKTLVEEWNMDSEAGDEIRTLYCLHNRGVIYGEQIEWCSPQEEGADTANASGWAYEVRWNVVQGKFFKSILERFVNQHEEPVPKPKLGPDAPKVFGLIPEVRMWSDLKLPDAMLQ